jgi:hypothetical protein
VGFSSVPHALQNLRFVSIRAPQSVQNFATGVGTWHVGHGIIASAEICVGGTGTAGTSIVGPVPRTGTATVDSIGETLDGVTGMTVGGMIGMRIVPVFGLWSGGVPGDCGVPGVGVAGGHVGDARGGGGGRSGGCVTPRP